MSETLSSPTRQLPSANGPVHVRAYTRVVNGRSVQVGEHIRSDPPGGDGSRLGRSDGESAQSDEGRAVMLAGRRDRCEEQRLRDDAICRILQFRSCWASSAFRYSQCLIGGYVPPLVTER